MHAWFSRMVACSQGVLSRLSAALGLGLPALASPRDIGVERAVLDARHKPQKTLSS
jgi:hypothetical protein